MSTEVYRIERYDAKKGHWWILRQAATLQLAREHLKEETENYAVSVQGMVRASKTNFRLIQIVETVDV